MTAIGVRIREERERLMLTQRAFGEIGGVEPNAQGKYESGERWPKADYLAAVANAGADVLYILTGNRAVSGEHSSPDEAALLNCYRGLPGPAKAALASMADTLSAVVPRKPDSKRGR